MNITTSLSMYGNENVVIDLLADGKVYVCIVDALPGYQSLFIAGYDEEAVAHCRRLAAKLTEAADAIDAKLAARQQPTLPAEFNQADNSPVLATSDDGVIF